MDYSLVFKEVIYTFKVADDVCFNFKPAWYVEIQEVEELEFVDEGY